MTDTTGDSNLTGSITAPLQECQAKMNISLNKVQFALSSHASSNVYVAIMESAEVLLTLSTYLNSAGSAIKAAAISQQLARMLKTAASQLKSNKRHKTSSRRNSFGSNATGHRYGGNSESTISNDPMTHSNNHSRSSSSSTNIHYNRNEEESKDTNHHHHHHHRNIKNNNIDKTQKVNGPPIALEEPHVDVVPQTENSQVFHDHEVVSEETLENVVHNEINALRDEVTRLHDERESWEATHEELLEYIEELETKLRAHSEKSKQHNNNVKNKKKSQEEDDLYSTLHELQDALEEEQLKSHSLNESLREAEQLIAHDDAEINQLREELKRQRELLSSREKEMHKEEQKQITTLQGSTNELNVKHNDDSNLELMRDYVHKSKFNELKAEFDQLQKATSMHSEHDTEAEHEQEIAALKATLQNQYARENDLLTQIRTLEQSQKALQSKENLSNVNESSNVNEEKNYNTKKLLVDSAQGDDSELTALRDANAKLLSQLDALEQHNVQLEQEMEDIQDEMEATRETAVVYAKKVKMCTLEVQDMHKELERVERSYAESQHNIKQEQQQSSVKDNILPQENSTQTFESQTVENNTNAQLSAYTTTIKSLQHELNELTAKAEAERVSTSAEIENWRNEAHEQTARANACEAAMRHQANELQERLLHLTHTLEEERTRNEMEMMRLQQEVKEHETKYTSCSESHIAEQTESQNLIRTLRTQNKVLEMKIAATEEEITRLSNALEEAEAKMESMTHAANNPESHVMPIEMESNNISRNNNKTDNMNTNTDKKVDEQMEHSSVQDKVEREKLKAELKRLAKINDEYLLLSAKYSALTSEKSDLESKLQLTSQENKNLESRNEELMYKIELLSKEIATVTVALDAEKVDNNKRHSAYVAEINDLRAIIETNKAVIDNLERASKELNAMMLDKDKLIAQLTESINVYSLNEAHLPHTTTKLTLDDMNQVFEFDVHELNDLRNTINANLVLLLEQMKNAYTIDSDGNGANASTQANIVNNNDDNLKSNNDNIINGYIVDVASFTFKRKLQNRFAEEMQLHKLKEKIDTTLLTFNDVTNRAKQEIEHIEQISEYLRFVLRRVNRTITIETNTKGNFDNAAFNTYICLLQRIEQLAAPSLQCKTNERVIYPSGSTKNKQTDNNNVEGDNNSNADLSYLAQQTPRKRTWRDTAREYSTSPLPSPYGQRQSSNNNNNKNNNGVTKISPRSNWRLERTE